MNRRCLLAGAALSAAARPRSPVRLISHRGAVSATIPENSAAAIEESIRTGFWMMEIDLRASADGEVVINHDADLRRVFGDSRTIAGTPWRGLQQARSLISRSPLLNFSEAAALAHGRTRYWLDIKDPDPSPRFLASVEATLRQYKLLGSVIVGRHAVASPYFGRKAKRAMTLEELFYLKESDEELRKRYVLVAAIGFALSRGTVSWAARKGITAVPFVGTGHYPAPESRTGGMADLKFLKESGVTTFMIDSLYLPAFAV